MNKTLIFRKIGGIISELTEQYQYLAESPENINPLELELFIANSHFLAEHLAILKKLEGSPELLSQSTSVKNVSVEEADTSSSSVETIVLPVPEDLHATNPEIINEPKTPEQIGEPQWFQPMEHEKEVTEELGENDTDQHIIVLPEMPDVDWSKANDLNVHSSKPIPEPPVGNVNVAEKDTANTESANKVPTLNEILSEGKSRSNFAASITHEEKDLKSMIKLNDKLMFVRDLFGGYSLAYSEAIELVNRFDNFEAADNFLKQNYAVKNKWSEKQASVDQFYEILNRRFS